MGKKGIVDRFEEDWAVIEMEDGEFIDLPIRALPPNIREGSMVFIENNKVILLAEEIQIQRCQIETLMDDLFED